MLRVNPWLRFPFAAGPYRSWLQDRQSLTQRLQERGGKVGVRVLFQCRCPLLTDEQFLAPAKIWGLTREVVLSVAGQDVVYAHSVLIPHPAHMGAFGSDGWRLMKTIHARPLGAALFSDPKIKRYALQAKKLGRGHALYRRTQRLWGVTGERWARRSLFRVGQSWILVTEVFLPKILAL
ncbi:MAG: chorismate lyase [Betaproteobacteria bacterium]